MPDPTTDDAGTAIAASEPVIAAALFVETVGTPTFCDVCGVELRNGDAYYPAPARHGACNALIYRESQAEEYAPNAHSRQ